MNVNIVYMKIIKIDDPETCCTEAQMYHKKYIIQV